MNAKVDIIMELNMPSLIDQTHARPNTGRSLKAALASGPDSLSQREWRATHGIKESEQIKLVRIAHVRYQHPDLEKATIFLKDFGMSVVKQTEDKRWFAGYGPDPYCYYAQQGPKEFLGATFLVERLLDLERVSQLPGASRINKMEDAPGGGMMVTLRDPEGFLLNFVWGQELREGNKISERLLMNDEAVKDRKGAYQRFENGPAAVYKLGHFGLSVPRASFLTLTNWYCQTFNMVPTDYLYVFDDSNRERQLVGAFFHIDRGSLFVDHHTFFVTAHGSPHVHHSSFEVHDMDSQQLGHSWLADKGYTSVWGVGRHILGSQVFDYWWDPTGFMIEHYADGDLVNEDTPISILPATDETLAIWGPKVPTWFLE